MRPTPFHTSFNQHNSRLSTSNPPRGRGKLSTRIALGACNSTRLTHLHQSVSNRQTDCGQRRLVRPCGTIASHAPGAAPVAQKRRFRILQRKQGRVYRDCVATKRHSYTPAAIAAVKPLHIAILLGSRCRGKEHSRHWAPWSAGRLKQPAARLIKVWGTDTWPRSRWKC